MKNIIKKIGRILFDIAEIIVVAYVILVTSCILCRNKFGYTQFGDYTLNPVKEETAEYIKNVKSGDLVIIKNAGAIKEGDLIYFYDVIAQKYVIRSEVVKEIKYGDTVSLYTVGDNRIVNSNRVIGKYSSVKHTWGLILNILVSRLGFLFLVLLPIMLIFIYQVYGFIIMIKYDDDFKKEDKSSSKKSKEEELI